MSLKLIPSARDTIFTGSADRAGGSNGITTTQFRVLDKNEVKKNKYKELLK